MRFPFETAPSARIQEAVSYLCDKEVHSTTLERLRLAHEAEACVRDLPQPLQLGEGSPDLRRPQARAQAPAIQLANQGAA